MKESKPTKPIELRGMPEEELRTRIREVRQELVTLRLKAQRRALEQPHHIRQMRRHLARMLTILRERVHPAGVSQESGRP